MGEGFRAGSRGRGDGLGNGMHTSEPVACGERDGTTPTHLEPGRETSPRRGYWRDARWESRSARHTRVYVLSFELNWLGSFNSKRSTENSRSGAAWSSGSSSGS